MIEVPNYAVCDLETTSIKSFRRVANPIDPRNKMIAAVIKTKDMDKPQLVYDVKGIETVPIPWDKIDVLVNHNIKFDLLYMWRDPALQEWLSNGGKIWDTSVAEYLLSAQLNIYPKLDDCAIKAGGTVKDDRIKLLFKQGIGAEKIDPELLLPYAEADGINTELVYLWQLREADRKGMMPLLQAYMEHTLALVEMEFNGMKVDVDLARSIQTDFLKELEAIRNRFQTFVDNNKQCEEELEFNLNSPEHISALLFNSPIRIIKRVPHGVYGPKAKKAGEPKLRVERSELRLGIFFLPHDLSTPAKKRGTFATNNKILERVEPYCPKIISEIMRYREINKLSTTYLEGIKQTIDSKTKEVKVDTTGILPLVTPWDGCVHGEMNHTSTVTGRLSSKNPNMQNIPGDLNKLFPSRFPNGKIISIDYSQLEVCLQAFNTQSEKMINDVINGVDFHVKRAGYAAGLSYEEVLEKVTNDEPGWKQKRKEAKAISFAKAYGAGATTIAENAKLPIDTVERVLHLEHEEYPEVEQLLEVIQASAARTRVPSTNALWITEKIRDPINKDKILEVITTKSETEKSGIGFYKTLTGKVYAFEERGAMSQKMREAGRDVFRFFSRPEMANYPTQGLAADILAITVGKLFRYLREHESTYKNKVLLINEIHDAILLDVNLDEKDLTKFVHDAIILLCDVDKYFLEFFGVKFNVPIKVDVTIGDRWGERDE